MSEAVDLMWKRAVETFVEAEAKIETDRKMAELRKVVRGMGKKSR